MQVNTNAILLLESLTLEEANKVSKYAVILEKKAGDPILVKADQVGGIYTIIEGEVGVYIEGNKLLTNLIAGESFGEMSYLEGVGSSATIRALTDPTKLIVFTKEAFDQIATEHAIISAKIHEGIAKSLSRKLRKTNQKISDLISEISSDVEVSNFKIALSTSYTKLRECTISLTERYKDLEKFSKSKTTATDPERLKTKLLAIEDGLDSLRDKVDLIEKGISQVDGVAKRLEEIRHLSYGKFKIK